MNEFPSGWHLLKSLEAIIPTDESLIATTITPAKDVFIFQEWSQEKVIPVYNNEKLYWATSTDTPFQDLTRLNLLVNEETVFLRVSKSLFETLEREYKKPL